MQEWVTIDRASVGSSEFVLARRGEEWVVRVDRQVLMSSRVHQSEIALAEESVRRARTPRRMLIGGLGLGFTLRAALDALAPGASVTVVELVEALVTWNRGPLAHLHGQALEDPRVTVLVGDAFDVVRLRAGAFDVIALDVDNGPTAMSQAANHRLYTERGVRACVDALAPGGVLAVWSAGPDDAYAARLSRAGLATEVVRTPARKGARATHVLFFGRKR